MGDSTPSAASEASVVADFEGSQEINDDISASWKYTSANKTLTLTAKLGKDAWFAIAFPEIECRMSPAVSVIAIPEDGEVVNGNTYKITFNSMSGLQESNDMEGISVLETYKEGEGEADTTVVIALEKVVPDFSSPLSVTWPMGPQGSWGTTSVTVEAA